MLEARKLATIAFADIAGYSAMMQTDEKKAMLVIDAFQDILETEMASHQGEIIQYYGDGCLLSFESALEGLHAATILQGQFIASDIPVRIGMHLGDVIFKNNNVFGDGVNIASRVESLGVPGSVLISKTIRDQVKNKTEFSLEALGSFQFKNISEKMEVFAVANEGFNIPKAGEMRGKLEVSLPAKASQEEQKEWERHQMMEILDAVEDGTCVLIMGNYAFSKPGEQADEEIFLPDILRREQEKLSGKKIQGDKIDFYSAAQSLFGRAGGKRRLMKLADIKWDDLGPRQQARFQRISEVPFDLILSTYPFDLLHEAFKANQIAHQYDSYSFLREAVEPEQFDATKPLIYNLFGNPRHKESMVISLDRLYQFLFSVLGARTLPKLVQDKVQQATHLVFLGFSFDDWYMKLLLRVLKVHEKDSSYAHPPGPGGLRQRNQMFFESNFQVTFLDRQINEFVEELHSLCGEEGLLRRKSLEHASVYQNLRSQIAKYRLEEAIDQLDEIMLQDGKEGVFLRELGEYHRSYHKIKEWEQYERFSEEELDRRWQQLRENLFSLIDRVEAKIPA